jgi:hypothetical protein
MSLVLEERMKWPKYHGRSGDETDKYCKFIVHAKLTAPENVRKAMGCK